MPADFSNQNLRGKSFKGQDLAGANFRGADLRGVNFEGAKLVGADFRQVCTGMTYSRALVRGIGVFLVSGLLSLFAYVVEIEIIHIFTVRYPRDELRILLSHIQRIEITILLITTFAGFSYLILIRSIFAVIRLIAIVGIIFGLIFGLAFDPPIGMTGSIALAIAMFGGIAVTGAMTGIIAGIFAIMGVVAGGASATIVIVFLFLASYGKVDTVDHVVVVFGIIAHYLYFYIASLIWCIRKEDERFAGIRQFGIAFNAYGSTNFRTADLTEANFSEANLKSARFLNAVTTRTCWQQAKKLETANLKGTMLEKRAIRQLLVTGNGQNQSFAGCNLKGAYLANANLQNVDLTETDLIGADLRGANLTGACLENWLIDSTTRLEGAHADYVYLLRNQQERRPASGIFETGEFAKLFQEVLTTVDFIFNNGIDWKAFLVSFEKLRVQYGETEVSVQSIENKGDGVIVVKISVPPETNKAELHQAFKKGYESKLKLLETELKGSKDDRIHDLHRFLELLAQTQKPIEIHSIAQAEITMNETSNKTITIGDVDNRGGVFTIADLMKDVTNSINQLPAADDTQLGLKEQLIQFQTLILQTSEEELPADVRKLALEQLKMLAQIGKDPKNANKTTVQMLLSSLKGLTTHLAIAAVAHVAIAKIAEFF